MQTQNYLGRDLSRAGKNARLAFLAESCALSPEPAAPRSRPREKYALSFFPELPELPVLVPQC